MSKPKFAQAIGSLFQRAHRFSPCRSTANDHASRAAGLRFEPLEGRILLSASPLADGQHAELSSVVESPGGEGTPWPEVFAYAEKAPELFPPSAAEAQPGTIEGRVYSDDNSNGVADPAEAGIASASVFLDTNANGALDTGERNVVTNSTGAYQLTGLAPGTYEVVTTLPSGIMALPSQPATGRSTLIVDGSGQTQVANFGYRGAGLFGGDFNGGTLPPGWIAAGDVTFVNGEVRLGENGGTSTLSYDFIVPAGTEAMSLIFPTFAFASNGPNPPDAIEVAVRDRQTGASLFPRPTGLSGSDAVLNVQSNGRIYLAPGTTIFGREVSSGGTIALDRLLPVVIDLRGVPEGTAASLSIDLLSFGQQASSVRLDNVVLGIPQGISGELEFETSALSVGESAGTATLTVRRVNGAIGRVTVPYSTVNGSATSGQDFVASAGELVFETDELT
ncbi:MAG TPA: SdrD B-like domain-containing protein, partial [Chthoniobacteraceae bacterium]